MRGRLLAFALALLLAVAVAAPVGAVTNGQPDGNEHSYVGLLVFDTLVEGVPTPTWRCSGSLLSPTVVLTAGHCTDGAVAARAWFQPDVTATVVPPPLYPWGGPGSGAIEGTPYVYPEYSSPGPGLVGFSFGDVGIVVLSQPVPTSQVATYAELPSAGLVDTLANKTPLDFVGFGVQDQAQIPGNLLPQPPPYYRWTGPRIRNYVQGALIAGSFRISDDVIKVTMNPGGDKGGTCFGDSGGPDLLGGTAVVLAVNSFVTNVNCAGVGYDTRIDVPARLNWIKTFLAGPTACTFAASDSEYYNGPDPSYVMYGNGPVSFTWDVTTRAVTGGTWDEIVPPTSGTVYYNVVTSGTVSATGSVTLHFTRSVPNAYAFDAGGLLSGLHFVGWADGTQFLWTADGSVTCR